MKMAGLSTGILMGALTFGGAAWAQTADEGHIALSCHEVKGSHVEIDIDGMVDAEPGEQDWLEIKNRSDAVIAVLTRNGTLHLMDGSGDVEAMPCSGGFDYSNKFLCVAFHTDKTEQTSFTLREYSVDRGASFTVLEHDFAQGQVSVMAMDCQPIPLAALNGLDR